MTENLTDLNFYIRRNKVCFYNKLQEGINIRAVKGLQFQFQRATVKSTHTEIDLSRES